MRNLSTQGVSRLGRLVLVSLALSLAGCATSSGDAPLTNAVGFDSLITGIVEEARAAGASEEQMRLLQEAADRGIVSPEVMRQAITNLADCVTSVGLGFEWGEETGPRSLPFMNYGISVPSGTSEELMDNCETLESRYVSAAYQLQPAMDTARRDLISDNLPDVIACLQSAGVEIDANATVDEVRPAVAYAATGYTPGSTDPPPIGFTPTDCAAAVGMTMTDFSY